MTAFDIRGMDEKRREALAWRIREQDDFRWPELSAWNTELCPEHIGGWQETVYDPETGEDVTYTIRTRPPADCRKCGIRPRAHQRVGAAWLWTKKKALLADSMGLGKTAHAAMVIAMMAETGELGDPIDGGNGRVIIVARSPALGQWQREMRRMLPGIHTIIAQGSKAQRNELYLQNWQVLLIGPEMMLREWERLERFPVAAVVSDDIDQLRNETKISWVLDRYGQRADRYIIMTGTPLQKRLDEMHSVLDGIGGMQVFGSLNSFKSRYIRYESSGGFGAAKPVGYKNIDEFKAKLAPFVLRRTAADLFDITLPTIQRDEVFLELYPRQRAKYRELQQGVLEIMKETGTQVKHLTAMSKLVHGAQICTGLATLGEPDGRGASSKLDWVMEQLTGDLEEEKVVVFADQKNTIRALQDRMTQANIPFVTIWGEDPNRERRQAAVDKFWDKGSNGARVLLGTRAIEQSLNLQIARHLINVDQIMNAARMAQLAGRIRRQGSVHSTVFVHNLFAVDTQEERLLPRLEEEQALQDHIWGNTSELYRNFSPDEMLRFITG